MLLFSSSFYNPYLLDMAAFNLTGQGMQRNAEVGLFAKLSYLVLLYYPDGQMIGPKKAHVK
jgi:hypothetical protein